VAIPDRRRWDGCQPEPDASDAWGDARRAEALDAAHLRPELRDAGAGKSVGRALDAREPDAWCQRRERQLARPERGAAVELCTQAEARFEERSCAAPGAAVDQQPEALPDAARALEAAAQSRQRRPEAPEAQQELAMRQRLAARALPDAAQPQAAQEVVLERRLASRRPEAQ